MTCDENTLKRKDTKWKKCGSVTGGKTSKPMARSKITSEPTFPIKNLSLQTPFEQKKDGFFFGYVQCDLVVPDELKSKFANFPPIFKNTEDGRNDIGDYMKTYAIENEVLKHPQRMLISSFKLENGTVITPLFNFYMELRLQSTKIYLFVQYSPRKCFNNFVSVSG